MYVLNDLIGPIDPIGLRVYHVSRRDNKDARLYKHFDYVVLRVFGKLCYLVRSSCVLHMCARVTAKVITILPTTECHRYP